VFGYLINQHKADIIVTAVAVLNTLFVSMIVQAELRQWHLYLHGRLKASRKVLDLLRDRYPSDSLLLDWDAKNKKISSINETRGHSCTDDMGQTSMNASSYHNDSKVYVESEDDLEKGEASVKQKTERTMTTTHTINEVEDF
jgi:hypothetical protein